MGNGRRIIIERTVTYIAAPVAEGFRRRNGVKKKPKTMRFAVATRSLGNSVSPPRARPDGSATRYAFFYFIFGRCNLSVVCRAHRRIYMRPSAGWRDGARLRRRRIRVLHNTRGLLLSCAADVPDRMKCYYFRPKRTCVCARLVGRDEKTKACV